MLTGASLWQAVGSFGPWGLVVLLAGFFIWLVLTGKLVPRSQLDVMQADRDHWRTSHDTQQQISLTQGMSLERLLVLAETSAHALQQIQLAQERGDLR